MCELNTEKWWDEEDDKDLIDQYALLSLLISPTFHLNEQEYLKLEEFLKNSPKGTKFKITVERNELEDIANYQKDLDEEIGRYYDEEYKIVEEKLYDL